MIPIGGIQKLSLVDYPGKTCAAVFTIGCNMRCGYCHNPELVLPERYAPSLPMDALMDFFRSRIGKLDAVTISGGEPTMHEALPLFIKTLKEMGFLIKLDTNGTNPSMLKELLQQQLVDFVAMDIKAPLKKYTQVVARPINAQHVKQSIDLILRTPGIEHEFRTTVLPCQLSLDDIRDMGKLVQGADRYALQNFVPGRTLAPALANARPYSEEEMQQAANIMQQFVRKVVVH